MRYILPEKTIRLVDEAHSIITGEPANLEITIDTTNARMISLIEALGGKIITPGMAEQPAVIPATFGNPIIAEETVAEPAAKTDAKPAAGEVKPVKACEICGKPVPGGTRAKICDDPACKRENQRRYMRAYKQRVLTATAGAGEEPAEDAPLAVPGQDLPGTMSPGTQEMAAGSL